MLKPLKYNFVFIIILILSLLIFSQVTVVNLKFQSYSYLLKKIEIIPFFIIIIGILLLTWIFLLKKKEKTTTAQYVDAFIKFNESEEKYRTLINHLNVGVAVISREGEYLVYNQKFQDLLSVNNKLPHECSLEEFATNYNVEGLQSKEWEKCTFLEVLLAQAPIYDYTLSVKKPETGTTMWVKTDVIPEYDHNNILSKILITAVDITDRKLADIALYNKDIRLQAFTKAIPDLFFLLDYEGRYIDYYGKNTELLYSTPDEFIGKNVGDVLREDLADLYIQTIKKAVDTNNIQTIEYALEINGKENYFESRLVLCGEDRIMAVVRDITSSKASELKLYNLSVQDTLTGLYNRNFFEGELDRYQSDNSIGVGMLVCDIDGLVLINDKLGHSCGDEYLKIAAGIIRQCARSEDIIARIGGDEFAIFMRNTTMNEIFNIKVEIEKKIQQINTNERSIPISVSIGYTMGNKDISDLRDVLKAADKWMYREKLHHLQSEKSKSIEMLIKMLEARDFITEGHGDRMQELCCQLAEAVGMSEGEIKDMRLFAIFHDIGKIGIPDRILFKPGKLTGEEMDEMKRHTEIGFQIAKTSQELMHISDWIIMHHEWWNGNGYPFNLRGEAIPIQCRILSIVDAYDAMTNDRPYRKALSKELAFKEIIKFKRSQFDPELTDKFVELFNN